jgi:NADH-ubiquinone oxidoreductase chain 6
MTGLEVFTMLTSLKFVLTSLAIISGVFVIGTKNAIISVFNLIVLYILVAFYLIYIGVTFLGIAYIVVYIGAIAILFLFIIMMIDIEVVEKRSNNYLPLLFLLIVGFVVTLKNILYTMGVMKIKSLVNYDKKEVLVKKDKETLFHIKDDFLPKLHQNPIFVNSVHKR